MIEDEDFDEPELPEIFTSNETKEEKIPIVDLLELETINEIFCFDLQINIFNHLENINEP